VRRVLAHYGGFVAGTLTNDDEEYSASVKELAELTFFTEHLQRWASRLCASAQQVEDESYHQPSPSAARAYAARLRVAALLLESPLSRL
jgi:hypothetical protein